MLNQLFKCKNQTKLNTELTKTLLNYSCSIMNCCIYSTDINNLYCTELVLGPSICSEILSYLLIRYFHTLSHF